MRQSPKKNRIVLTVVMMLILILAGIQIFFWSNEKGKELNTDGKFPIENFQRQLDRIETRVSANDRKSSYIGMKVNELENRRVAGDGESEDAAASSMPDTVDEDLMSPEETEKKVEELAQRKISFIEDSLDNEPRDNSWADSAVESFYQVYADDSYTDLGLNIDVECKSTLCQIDFSILNEAAREAGIKKLLVDAPWKSEGFTSFNIETGSGTFYLAREGHKLPDPSSN